MKLNRKTSKKIKEIKINKIYKFSILEMKQRISLQTLQT